VNEGEIEARIRKAVSEGCDILDIGGYSSRPGAAEVPVDEECRRVAMGVEIARRVASQIPISIDTFRSEVAEHILERFGKVVINDISAGELDSRMVQVVARAGVPYIAMHMRGTPQNMQQCSDYGDVASEVIESLRCRAEWLKEQGVRQVILDPGFGFAKSLEQNYSLLARLSELTTLGYPVLAGVSRKSMIYKALNTTQEDALTGTIALNWECLRAGCRILRVHDTREAVQIVKLFQIYEANR
jgi:dihydropteroate synthase